MTIKLSAETVKTILDRSKIFSALQTQVSKYYCTVTADKKLKVIIKNGSRSLFETSFSIESSDIKELYFSVDFDKFLNALKKMPGDVDISIDEKNFTVVSTVSGDRVTLTITIFDATSSEVDLLNTFFESKSKIFKEGYEFTYNPFCHYFFNVAQFFMNGIKNNSVALYKNKLLYSDRSIIVSVDFPGEDFIAELKDDYITVHKYIMNFMSLVFKYNGLFTFSKDKNFVSWKADDDFKAILAIENCIITIPTEDDIKNIAPDSDDHYEFDDEPFMNAIDFFSGFYDSSIWKPIYITFPKFNTGKDQEVKFFYKQPMVAEIETLTKAIEVTKGNDEDVTCILSSDALKQIVSLCNDNSFFIKANNKQPGVELTYTNKKDGDDGNSVFVLKVVFAKLEE
jgi:hypothetical protein